MENKNLEMKLRKELIRKIANWGMALGFMGQVAVLGYALNHYVKSEYGHDKNPYKAAIKYETRKAVIAPWNALYP